MTVEDNIKELLESNINLRDKKPNDISLAYALRYTTSSYEDVVIFKKVLNSLPPISTLVRVISKVRSENPELDNREKSDVQESIKYYQEQII